MKYVIEDDINFFDELNNIDDESNNNLAINLNIFKEDL